MKKLLLAVLLSAAVVGPAVAEEEEDDNYVTERLGWGQTFRIYLQHFPMSAGL